MSGGARAEILAELEALGFRSSARRGQNFLFDRQLLEALIDDCDAGAREPISPATVLEVGAGAGTLTRRLVARGFEVLAVEIDPVLCDYLRRHIFADDAPGATLIAGDVLHNKNRLAADVDDALRRSAPYRLIANLPYAIATPLLQLLLCHDIPPVAIGALVQEELALRWCAGPGSKDYGPASVMLQLCGAGAIRRRVPAHLFTPRPRVESAFYVWHPRGAPPPERGAVNRLCRGVFSSRRKMLRSQLGERLPEDDPWWRRAGLDARMRPEEVPPPGFLALAKELERRGAGPPESPSIAVK